ncbi:MAG: hypothetical protein DRQ99_30915, partial [Candidatus Parabeggiatoa sp. nov. 3]
NVLDKYFKAGGAIVDDPSLVVDGVIGPTVDALNRGEYGEAGGEFAALLVFGILDPLKGGGKAGRVGGSINRMVPDELPDGSGGGGSGGGSSNNSSGKQYPAPTPESDAEASKIVGFVDEIRTNPKSQINRTKNTVVGVIVRKDGSVVVGISGKKGETEYVLPQLEKRLENETLPEGEAKYQMGLAEGNTEGHERPDGVLRDSKTCVETKMWHCISSLDEVAGTSVEWRGREGKNSHAVKPGSKNMRACPSCKLNKDKILPD